MFCYFSFSIKWLLHHHQNPRNTDRSTSSYLLLVWIKTVKKWFCAIVGNLTEKIFPAVTQRNGRRCLTCIVFRLNLSTWPSSKLSTVTILFLDVQQFVWFHLNKQCQCKLITDDCNRCEINVNKCYFSYLWLLVVLCYYYTVLGYLNMYFTTFYAHWAPLFCVCKGSWDVRAIIISFRIIKIQDIQHCSNSCINLMKQN